MARKQSREANVIQYLQEKKYALDNEDKESHPNSMQDEEDESSTGSSLSSYYLQHNDDDESSTGSLFIPPTDNPITKTWNYCLRHIQQKETSRNKTFFVPVEPIKLEIEESLENLRIKLRLKQIFQQSRCFE